MKIFLVEDDPWYGELLKYHLSLNPDNIVFLFDTAKECLSNLYQKPDVVCTDYGLPDLNGLELLKKLKSYNNALPVIVISGQEEVEVAVSLLKQGAVDYILKDDNAKDLLWNSITKIRDKKELETQVETLKEELEQKYGFENEILGHSNAIKKIYGLIEKAIKSTINVSVTGETGTGKELVAKAIHYNSARKKLPFVAVNVAAIPKDLIESELFGYEKGAFTGAIARKTGKFEEVKGGTLFLDEIGEMDLNLQSKILRVLQEREMVRVGGNETIKLEFRLITATHRDLTIEVERGNFREDLYYRIMGLPILLPPLRERGNDVLILSKRFIDDFVKENKMNRIALHQTAKDKLLSHSFPGNVRELKAIVELACIMCNGTEIVAEDLSFSNFRGTNGVMSYDKTLKEYTIELINSYLKKYNNNVVLVAEKLDIGKSTIYSMIKNGEIVYDKGRSSVI
jgi:two-component system, NtrC family, response regulator AtoC